jgi:hypothetical protein
MEPILVALLQEAPRSGPRAEEEHRVNGRRNQGQKLWLERKDLRELEGGGIEPVRLSGAFETGVTSPIVIALCLSTADRD